MSKTPSPSIKRLRETLEQLEEAKRGCSREEIERLIALMNKRDPTDVPATTK